MFDFVVRKSSIKSTQNFIDKLDPKIDIHVPEDLSLPNVQMLKKLCPMVSQVKSFEEELKRLNARL